MKEILPLKIDDKLCSVRCNVCEFFSFFFFHLCAWRCSYTWYSEVRDTAPCHLSHIIGTALHMLVHCLMALLSLCKCLNNKASGALRSFPFFLCDWNPSCSPYSFCWQFKQIRWVQLFPGYLFFCPCPIVKDWKRWVPAGWVETNTSLYIDCHCGHSGCAVMLYASEGHMHKGGRFTIHCGPHCCKEKSKHKLQVTNPL